ncbi:MAG: hypothetical protein Q8N23_00905 [Archangium sp.]|nr:hypothetical protein [Archangium sp.]MDP3151194.1 hypothetical protein [Archangium sp.]MDP3570165.1 hypothetical protein [Archangium sp.]
MSEALNRLTADDFVNGHGEPTHRWHAAVARAATQLLSRGEDLVDLRVPVAWALSENYAGSASDDELVEMVAVMTPLTAVTLHDEQAGPNGRGEVSTQG